MRSNLDKAFGRGCIAKALAKVGITLPEAGAKIEFFYDLINARDMVLNVNTIHCKGVKLDISTANVRMFIDMLDINYIETRTKSGENTPYYTKVIPLTEAELELKQIGEHVKYLASRVTKLTEKEQKIYELRQKNVSFSDINKQLSIVGSSSTYNTIEYKHLVIADLAKLKTQYPTLVDLFPN